MMLKVDFPQNLITDELLRQERIPCVCKVAKEFEVFLRKLFLNRLEWCWSGIGKRWS